MSSIKCPKDRAQKTHFLSPIFALFLLQNHNILWSNRLIFPFDHNSSSVLYTQRGPSCHYWCQRSWEQVNCFLALSRYLETYQRFY